MKAWIIMQWDLSEDGDTETLEFMAKNLEKWMEEDGMPMPEWVAVRDSLTLDEPDDKL